MKILDKQSLRVVVMGSTGSIGRQTLEVAEALPGGCRVIGLAGGKNLALLEQQAAQWQPGWVAIGDETVKDQIKNYPALSKTELLWGMEGLCQLAALPEADLIIQALGGAIGIQPTVAAIRAGKRIGLANKETLVAAGDIVIPLAAECGAAIIPVDSEHSAIFQCLQGEKTPLKNLWLTASGGPFYRLPEAELEQVTVEDALRHPRWTMGPKITVDSATLMNKGLEVIEAHHLFQMPYDRIQVLVHPESAIHSMIETVDHALIAQLGAADMRLPIQYAFTWPERAVSPAAPLDLAKLGTMHFVQPDVQKFPALAMAYEVGQTGGTLPAVMNAANETAVAAFLHRRIGFRDIYRVTRAVTDRHASITAPALETVLAADRQARLDTEAYLREILRK